MNDSRQSAHAKAQPSAPPPPNAARVLIIQLGPLGAFVQSLAAAKTIRDYHFGARITLLTTEPFALLAEKCPYFDIVEADGKPRDPKALAELLARLRAAKYEVVYDLHATPRTNGYFLSLQPKPPLWSGAAPGCSHPHLNPARARMHRLDALADQLAEAGLARATRVGDAPPADLRWVRRALSDAPRLQPEYFSLRTPYVMLVPGAPGAAPGKLWPAERYAELARRIAARGAVPVVIGAVAEREIGGAVAKAEPLAKNLVCRTDLFQLAALAERAAFAVGQDSGPMHIAAAAGAPCLVLFPQEADAEALVPRGRRGAAILTAERLADLPAEEVDRALRNLGAYETVAAKAS